MPPTSSYSIWNNTTIILVVDGNFNMVEGNLRYQDRSTTTTNTDSFNVEFGNTATRQSPLPTTSPAPVPPAFPVPPNPSVERPDHDTKRPPSISEAPYQPVNISASVQSTRETSSLDDEHSPLLQSPTEATEPQLTNRFKSVYTKIKDRLKRAFDFL